MSCTRQCLAFLALCATLIGAVPPSAAQAGQTRSVAPGYQYLSPLPGSVRVSRFNNVVIRQGELIDPASVDVARLSVVGDRSGPHAGDFVLSDDGRTLVFNSREPFAVGERVTVGLRSGTRTLQGTTLPALTFQFHITNSAIDQRDLARLGLLPSETLPLLRESSDAASPATPLASAGLSCDTLPPTYPPISLIASDSLADERIFLAPFSGSLVSHLAILDGYGHPLYYRTFPAQTRAHDFKLQQGHPTVWLEPARKYFEMDSSYALIDSFAAGNGYGTDSHGFQLLPNGHALVQIAESQFVDMSAIVPGGNPNAWVIGYTIQELDASKNVIFQWRSFDHYAITDARSSLVTLTDSTIDYVHGNAVELDQDGNILISARHMNEITKIDRATGDIIWRLGRNAANNEFSFPNDLRGFSHQHDIRRIPNGNITVFDNGNDLAPIYSRGAEYQLDETNKIATLVWEHREMPDIYAGFMGNVQRHDDGTTMIGWGGTSAPQRLTDLRADGTTAFSIGMPSGTWTYRAFRFPWQTNRFTTSVSELAFGNVVEGNSAMLPVTVRNTSASDVMITCLSSSDAAFSVSGVVPFTLASGDSSILDVVFAPTDQLEHRGNVYVRQVSDTELVARAVAVTGSGVSITSVPGAGDLAFRLHRARPNPFGGFTVIRFELPRAENVRLEVFDIHGRKMETLIDGFRPAGSHEAVWTPRGRPSGLYFYRLLAGGQTLTRKLILTN